MKLFTVVISIYLGIDAVVVFIKTLLEPKPFSSAAMLDIVTSLGLMVWAVFLLVR